MSQLTQKEAIEAATEVFAQNFVGKMSVSSAIQILALHGRAFGHANPTIAAQYANDERDVEAQAAIQFFLIMGGKLSVAEFVRDVFIHAAVKCAHETIEDQHRKEVAIQEQFEAAVDAAR